LVHIIAFGITVCRIYYVLLYINCSLWHLSYFIHCILQSNRLQAFHRAGSFDLPPDFTYITRPITYHRTCTVIWQTVHFSASVSQHVKCGIFSPPIYQCTSILYLRHLIHFVLQFTTCVFLWLLCIQADSRAHVHAWWTVGGRSVSAIYKVTLFVTFFYIWCDNVSQLSHHGEKKRKRSCLGRLWTSCLKISWQASKVTLMHDYNCRELWGIAPFSWDASIAKLSFLKELPGLFNSEETAALFSHRPSSMSPLLPYPENCLLLRCVWRRYCQAWWLRSEVETVLVLSRKLVFQLQEGFGLQFRADLPTFLYDTYLTRKC